MDKEPPYEGINPADGEPLKLTWLSSWDVFMPQPILHATRVGVIWWLTSTSLEYTLNAALHIVLFTLLCVLSKLWAGTWHVSLTSEHLEWRVWFSRKTLRLSDIGSIQESQKYGLSLSIQTSNGTMHLPIYGICDLPGLRTALRSKGYPMEAFADNEIKLSYRLPPKAYSLLFFLALVLLIQDMPQMLEADSYFWLHLPLAIFPLAFYPIVPMPRHLLQIKESNISKVEFFPYKQTVSLNDPFALELKDQELVVKQSCEPTILKSDMTIPITTAKFEEIHALLKSRQNQISAQLQPETA